MTEAADYGVDGRAQVRLPCRVCGVWFDFSVLVQIARRSAAGVSVRHYCGGCAPPDLEVAACTG